MNVEANCFFAENIQKKTLPGFFKGALRCCFSSLKSKIKKLIFFVIFVLFNMDERVGHDGGEAASGDA